jgi:hypothetical protein
MHHDIEVFGLTGHDGFLCDPSTELSIPVVQSSQLVYTVVPQSDVKSEKDFYVGYGDFPFSINNYDRTMSFDND